MLIIDSYGIMGYICLFAEVSRGALYSCYYYQLVPGEGERNLDDAELHSKLVP